MNYERLLMRLRRRVHDLDSETKEAQAIRLMKACKRRLEPAWAERRAQVDHEAGQRLLRAWS